MIGMNQHFGAQVHARGENSAMTIGGASVCGGGCSRFGGPAVRQGTLLGHRYRTAKLANPTVSVSPGQT
jgi:hypothetical protein